MDARLNPYLPGAGLRPVELAGRDRELEAFDVLRHRAIRARSAQSLIMTGLRGVGKTVLLNELADAARRDEWITAKIEADLGVGRSPFRQQVALALTASLRLTQGRAQTSRLLHKALRTFASFSVSADLEGRVTVGFDLDPAPGRADTNDIQTDLTELAVDLGDAAAEMGIGVCLFIDEMQHLERSDLAAVCQACHEAGQRRSPFFIVGAGLPSLPGRLAEAKSYAERLFEYMTIDRLADLDGAAALTRPAEEEGATWTHSAIRCVLEASGGYPYFIQQFGKTTWDAAQASPIDDLAAADGIRIGRQRLDRGFFRARWERATPSERRYLGAMTRDGDGPSSSGEVSERLGKKATSLGPTRANLIAKGLIYAPEHGLVAFTVPGMAGFIEREIGDSPG